MRWVVGDRAITGFAASASQMGRFETKWLCRPENLATLAGLSGEWIDKVQQRRPLKMIVLDMDSSESPTYGEQEHVSAPRRDPPAVSTAWRARGARFAVAQDARRDDSHLATTRNPGNVG